MRSILLSIWKHLLPERLKHPISRLLNHRFNIGLVGVFFDDQGRVLCFHHTYRAMPWGVPTGWLEHTEQPEEGLLREIEEESGLRVEICGIHKVEIDRSRADIIMLGKFIGGEFNASKEVDNWGLFSLDKLPTGLHVPQIKIINEAWKAFNDKDK